MPIMKRRRVIKLENEGNDGLNKFCVHFDIAIAVHFTLNFTLIFNIF